MKAANVLITETGFCQISHTGQRNLYLPHNCKPLVVSGKKTLWGWCIAWVELRAFDTFAAPSLCHSNSSSWEKPRSAASAEKLNTAPTRQKKYIFPTARDRSAGWRDTPLLRAVLPHDPLWFWQRRTEAAEQTKDYISEQQRCALTILFINSKVYNPKVSFKNLFLKMFFYSSKVFIKMNFLAAGKSITLNAARVATPTYL